MQSMLREHRITKVRHRSHRLCLDPRIRIVARELEKVVDSRRTRTPSQEPHGMQAPANAHPAPGQRGPHCGSTFLATAGKGGLRIGPLVIACRIEPRQLVFELVRTGTRPGRLAVRRLMGDAVDAAPTPL